MDKNEALERRFSLNMTHLPNPIAESTCLNLNGSATRTAAGMKSAVSEFRWGGSPISPKNRSNSSMCWNNTSVHKSRSTATSPQRGRINLSKIDPRVYADVQSRGLVSRIVQYHENGSRLNRSMSAGNIYSKSGQNSIPQLQKNELPYRATQQTVAMTRISAPKKSAFYGNTLSSLLRSNSVISVQKSDEELSCENRPILHPPATENELAPTLSVLDVLKEISRKRINSDDSDGINDANKKYCNREYNDGPYEPSAYYPDQRLNGLQGVGAVTTSMPAAPGQSYKRQREQMLAPKHQQPLHYAQQLSSGPNGSVAVSTRPPLHIQHSPPEQMAKKRLCNYNNDITSSLSSSLIHANKRKFYEQQQRSTMQNSPPSLTEEYEAQKSKIQRQQTDLRLQQLTKSLRCKTPITPLPTTPLNTTAYVAALGGNIETKLDVPPSQSITAVKQTLSEPPRRNDNISSISQKPKLTLFNRNYNTEPQSLNKIDGNNDNLAENESDVNNGECADIQFVKPKKSSAIVNKKNPLIERTQKSKLAMMLSGLRGEIYHGDEGDDEVDKTSWKKSQSNAAKKTKTISSNSVGNTSAQSTNFVVQAADKSGNSTSETVTENGTTTVTKASSCNTNSLSTSIATTTSTAGSFKLTASPVSTSSTSASTNVSPSAVSTTVTKTTSPLVGIKLTPQKQVLDTSSKSSVTAPTLSFAGMSSKADTDFTSVSGTIASGVGAVPQLQGFSFGLSTKSTTSVTATTSPPTTTTATAKTTTSVLAVGGFKFDTAQNKTVTETATAAITTTSAVTGFTFGSFANANPSTTTTASTEATKPVFAFGVGTFSSTTLSATTTNPTFNVTSNTITIAPTTTAAAGFGAIGTGTFSFGAGNSSTTAALASSAAGQTTNASNPFGGGLTNNVFGVTASAPTTNTFAFEATPTTTQATATTAVSTGTATTNSTATPANLFSFGGDKSGAGSSTTTVTTNSAPFAFGANTQKANTAVTTSSNNVNKPIFSFGTAGSSTASNAPDIAATNTNPSSGNLFSFGKKSTPNEVTLFGNNNAVGNNTQPAAPTAASQPSAFTFGAVAAQPSTPAFGASNATGSTTAFTFGGGASTNKASATSAIGTPNNASLTGGFSFGVSNPTNPLTTTNNATSTNIFGGASSTLNNAASAVPSNTNIVKPTFSFGGNASTNTNTTTNEVANKSIFGGAAANTSTTNNLFGAFATDAARNNQANDTFSFNTNTASHNNNATPNNPFAAAASKPAVGGFSFNTNNKPAAATTAPAPFAFGGAANNTAVASASTTSTPFSFGGSSNSSGAPPNKTFTFGSSANSSNTTAPTMNAGNIFGGGVTQTNNNTQQAAVSPFNFSAGSTNGAAPASAVAAATATTNIFAPPTVPGTSGSGEHRPIRRATRRLQKT
ncbi:uncharacterized protein [Eurosta solidaginis]|uniref:uncharacterized protein n=1 Tax=Eurosta solidaginis TaxID=178769 RepID=UPI0035311728